MFKTRISSTPFTTDAANNYFRHSITGNSYRDDYSFLATLRALVAPRIKEGESVHLIFGQTAYTGDAIRSVSVERAISAICGSYSTDISGQLIIHSFAADQQSNIENMKLIAENFTTYYHGFYRLDKVTAFYRKSFNVDCYINPETKTVYVFVDNLDMKKMHYLQVSILAFMPWYLNQEDGLTADELALMQSLRETSSDNYECCLAKLAEGYDFRTARIRQLLSGFETRYERLECERVQKEIEAIDTEILRLNESIGDYLSRRNSSCTKLMGLEKKITEGGEDSEIMEYFLCNQRLVLENVSNTDMFFCVKDYLEYFDKDMAERVINNRRSYVYCPNGHSHTGTAANQMEKFMREVFLSDEPRLRIRVCAAYRFELNGNVSPCGHHDYGYDFIEYMPNPHIDRYNCMGNYSRTINSLLMGRNYIGALEQCIASCKSLNFGDSTVMNAFMNSIWGTGANNRCIELPDGRVVNPGEAIHWLEQQEAQSEQTEEAQ